MTAGKACKEEAGISTSAFRELQILQCGSGLCARWSAGCPSEFDTWRGKKMPEVQKLGQKFAMSR